MGNKLFVLRGKKKKKTITRKASEVRLQTFIQVDDKLSYSVALTMAEGIKREDASATYEWNEELKQFRIDRAVIPGQKIYMYETPE